MSNPLTRRGFIAVCAAASTVPLAAAAEPVPIIGLLSSRSLAESASLLAALHEGLKEGGFVEGQNAVIKDRWAENQYDRLPALAAELLRDQPAVIVVAGGVPAAFAAKAATSTTPIVFTSVGNPVEMGLVESLGHPGGNITGIDATMTAELDAKRLELLHELMPLLGVVGVLVNPNRPISEMQVKDVEAAARQLGLQVVVLRAGAPVDLDAAFAAIVERRLGALLITADPFFVSRRDQLVGLAARHAVHGGIGAEHGYELPLLPRHRRLRAIRRGWRDGG